MLVEKMHGLGNDFCIISYMGDIDYKALAIKMCDRRCGIGADGMIVCKTDPLEMIFYNADGSKAPMCGNGIRCFSKYVLEHNLIKRNKFKCLTGAGELTLEIVSEYPFMVKVNMGKPIFNNASIFVSDNLDSFGRILRLDKDKEVTIYSFFLGTVHTVIFVPDFDSDVINYASEICNNKLFTRKTNVNFVRVIDKENIEVKTFERGVGWTLACGTGACASVVCANKLDFCDKNVCAHLELGNLEIEIKKDTVYMTGPVEKVFECEYEEEKLC